MERRNKWASISAENQDSEKQNEQPKDQKREKITNSLCWESNEEG